MDFRNIPKAHYSGQQIEEIVLVECFVFLKCRQNVANEKVLAHVLEEQQNFASFNFHKYLVVDLVVFNICLVATGFYEVTEVHRLSYNAIAHLGCIVCDCFHKI